MELIKVLLAYDYFYLGQFQSEGQSISSNQPVLQQIYAIFSDGSISNISLASVRMEIIQPSQQITIPLSCDNPLQCGVVPQQNGYSEIYIPNRNEDNSSLILLKIEGEMLSTHNTETLCVFNDFVLQSNVDDYPLLIACVLTENDDRIRYILSNPYGNVTRNGIESVPLQRGVISPVILTLSDDDEIDVSSMQIISINAQNEVVVFRPGDVELDTPSLTLEQPCTPVQIQRVRLNMIFLLTCEGGQSYLVNVTDRPITFVSLPNAISALAHSARYSLTLTMSNSTATVSIQEMLSQSVATRIIQLNTVMIYGADFGPDDKFAYIATDRGIVFINVLMAFEGAAQFTHTAVIPVCSQCPPVVFLNSTFALVSSITTGSNQIRFFDLSTWPPVNSMNRTLNNQPKLYWYDYHYIEPTLTITVSPTQSVIPSSSATPTSYTDTNDHDGLSGGAIIGIVIGASAFMIITVTIICAVCRWQWQNTIHTTRTLPNVTEQLVTGGLE